MTEKPKGEGIQKLQGQQFLKNKFCKGQEAYHFANLAGEVR